MPLQYMHVQDQKSAGTEGGTLVIDTWNIHVLTTEVKNTIDGASLGSNQITLPAGTYFVDARTMFHRAGLFKLSWWNDTDGAHEVLGGGSGKTGVSGTQTARPRVRGQFTIAGEKTFELQLYSGTGRATDGAGFSVDDGEIEIYADVRIWKVS